LSESIMPNEKIGVYWCLNCNVPLLDKACGRCGATDVKYLSSSLKPIFPKEKQIFEEILGLDLPNDLFRRNNRVIADGKTLFRFKLDNGVLKLLETVKEVKSRLHEHTADKDYKRKTVDANKLLMQRKEDEAIVFIRNVTKEYEEWPKFISFSGGKDSITTAMLVKKAIGKIPLFFADTTLEYPETYEFIEKFAREYDFELVKDPRSNRFYRSECEFFELCEELGPPSQLFRWCCTVFKSYPVNKFYLTLSKDILTFDGIRRGESKNRKGYSKVSRVKKIPRQLAAYPIFYWMDFDVWLYIWTNNFLINPLYELGHSRIGCWMCPNASPLNCFFRKHTHLRLWAKFERVLFDYAKRHGKDSQWVIGDYWRLRRSRKDKLAVVSSKHVCGDQETFIYHFKAPINAHLLEFLKPFGNVDVKDVRDRAFYRVSGNPLNIAGVIGGFDIRVTFSPGEFLRTKKLFEKQIAKALNCIGCGGCIGVCPNGAINIVSQKFAIDQSRCSHCLLCTKSQFVTSGCVAISYKQKRKVVDQRNSNE